MHWQTYNLPTCSAAYGLPSPFHAFTVPLQIPPTSHCPTTHLHTHTTTTTNSIHLFTFAAPTNCPRSHLKPSLLLPFSLAGRSKRFQDSLGKTPWVT